METMLTDPTVGVFLQIMSILLGACVGSFANVVIHRWPQEQSLIRPGSSCPHCQKKIKFYENIPILSWLFLRGKCSGCQNKISIQYPVIELLTAIVFGMIYWVSGPSLTSLEMMLFTAAAIPCFFIDLKHMLLPDLFTLSGIVIGVLGSLINPALTTPVESLSGMLIGGGLFYFMAILYKRLRGIDGMGGGDIKLLAWLGALLGVQSLMFILLFSSFTGTFVGLIMMVVQKKETKNFAIPFGPFLILAAYSYYFIVL